MRRESSTIALPEEEEKEEMEEEEMEEEKL